MAILEGRNLRKTYRLGKRNIVPALRGVDISIEQGEMVAIMGPSGSGKSTLMHILGLLHAPDIDSGHGPSSDGPRPDLSFAGRDMVDVGENERTKIRASQMGFVFQDFNLIPTLTALENVMLACDYAGVTAPVARTRALEALDLVGLSDRVDHRPAELSGGEQQRVAIADEPTGNLDSERAEEVLTLLREFNEREGQTFVLVTHEPDVAAACHRIIRMRDGKIREETRPESGSSSLPPSGPGLALDGNRVPILAE
jgi:putative ABC transport system ATP-binding protein